MSEKNETDQPDEADHDLPVSAGIFNLTIAWYQSLASEHGDEVAAAYVSSYLHRLADGLVQHTENNKEEK